MPETPAQPIVLGAGIGARIQEQMTLRADDASRALLEAVQRVLSGSRGGRRRTRAGVVHVSSAPGEPPAEQTGRLQHSWVQFVHPAPGAGTFVVHFGVESVGVPYVAYFDPALAGYVAAPRIAARPFVRQTLLAAVPGIREAFTRPWLGGGQV